MKHLLIALICSLSVAAFAVEMTTAPSEDVKKAEEAQKAKVAAKTPIKEKREALKKRDVDNQLRRVKQHSR